MLHVVGGSDAAEAGSYDYHVVVWLRRGARRGGWHGVRLGGNEGKVLSEKEAMRSFRSSRLVDEMKLESFWEARVTEGEGLRCHSSSCDLRDLIVSCGHNVR